MVLTPSHGFATAAAVGVLVLGSIAVSEMVTPTAPYGPSVASNQAAAPVASGPSEIAKTPGAAPSDVLGVDASREPVERAEQAQPPVRVVRAAVRRTPPRPVDAAPSDAMLVVRDQVGTHVVNVPTVLVGSERILPASAVAATAVDGAPVSF